MNRGLACAPTWSPYTAGRVALPRDRLRMSNKDQHEPSGNYQNPITEPEKTLLGRATPVARERDPTGGIADHAAARRLETHTQEKRAHWNPQPPRRRRLRPKRTSPQNHAQQNCPGGAGGRFRSSQSRIGFQPVFSARPRAGQARCLCYIAQSLGNALVLALSNLSLK